MESESEIAFPLQAIWFGSSSKTFERIRGFAEPLFNIRFYSDAFELVSQQFLAVEPGCLIIMEASITSDFDEMLQSFDRIIREFVEHVKSPVILCIGDQLPAEIVVGWMRLGIFSYVELYADEARYQRAFHESALQAVKIRQQYLRYRKLSELWSSISDREGSVLDMLMDGFPNKTIANRLGVSQRTIEARRHSLYEKLESRSVVEVVSLIYELNNLEHVFKRIDVNRDPTSDSLPKEPKMLRPLPIRQRAAVELPLPDSRTVSEATKE